uniref:Uncharacterized protein n=1 Tax=Thermogemmatispora argillosa TaxID=2045280 RepID=A0A455T4J1_9CHLR|nr:hypothetical protein KTA_05130 [Thermogemmatispora argillosa]
MLICAAGCARAGILLESIYFCPHHPEGTVPALAFRSHCRKPQPGLLLQAAANLDLGLAQPWLVGDILVNCLTASCTHRESFVSSVSGEEALHEALTLFVAGEGQELARQQQDAAR